jgi:hypothetical protein
MLGMVVHIYKPSYLEGRGRNIASLRLAWMKLVRSSLKNEIQTKSLEI